MDWSAEILRPEEQAESLTVHDEAQHVPGARPARRGKLDEMSARLPCRDCRGEGPSLRCAHQYGM